MMNSGDSFDNEVLRAANDALTAEVGRLKASVVELNNVLDDYLARFVVLHDAWRTGDNSHALEALRLHVAADDAEGKNSVLKERAAAWEWIRKQPCPESYGFEGPETFSGCGKCLRCQLVGTGD